jgi:hypothetical protein
MCETQSLSSESLQAELKQGTVPVVQHHPIGLAGPNWCCLPLAPREKIDYDDKQRWHTIYNPCWHLKDFQLLSEGQV